METIPTDLEKLSANMLTAKKESSQLAISVESLHYMIEYADSFQKKLNSYQMRLYGATHYTLTDPEGVRLLRLDIAVLCQKIKTNNGAIITLKNEVLKNLDNLSKQINSVNLP
jgi:hypothetical protein